jgi:hypothetical protein
MTTLRHALGPQRGWLHSAPVDLIIMFAPWLLMAVFLVGASHETALAVWISQFVLGNTTHVVLTFLLLAVRRDVLCATPSQATLVIGGSVATFLVVWGLFRGVEAVAPNWVGFPLAVVAVFGTHHRLSQAKGIWSLYNLRGAKLQFPPPTPTERSLQQAWVSVGLILVMVAWLFIPSGPDRTFPLLQAIPNEPAFLPYEVAYLLVAGWLLFVGVLFWRTARARPRNVAKLVHIGTHGAAVSLSIVWPVWGGIVWGAIHGLEYYFLCARMMRPREGDARPGLGAVWVWPLVAAAMLPLFAVGLVNAPFASALFEPSTLHHEALVVVNALVAAHYFADAFIYRFRIPEVRRVALHRLGFA